MSEKSSSGGIGFFGLLTILFIGLKLGHVIDWSWWWILSPIWIPAVFILITLIIPLIVIKWLHNRSLHRMFGRQPKVSTWQRIKNWWSKKLIWFKSLFILLVLFFSFNLNAQTKITFNGDNAIETKVVFNSVQEVADYYNLTATQGTFTDSKGVSSPIYQSKKGIKYAIVARKPTEKNPSTYAKKSLTKKTN